jgi:hypothetical protein
MLDRLRSALALFAGPKTHMLHVPKTGGTAVAEALRPVARRHRLVFEEHAVALADIPAGDRVFVFLRHPVDKFVSGFNSRLRCGRPRYSFAWTPSEARSFSHFLTPNALAESLTSSDPQTAEFARSAMSGIRFVSDSMIQWFGSIENLRNRRHQFILLGLQTCLADDFEFLKRQLGLPGEIQLPSDDVLSHRTPQQFDKTLSALGRKNLGDWYAADIAFYEAFVALRKEWFGLPAAPQPPRPIS